MLRYRETHFDWVRPGIMLYGCSPFADESATALGLQPVMTLASELIAVQTLGPGARVGYGGEFVTDRPLRIGVVACGYADGYPRHAPTGTPVLVDGVRTRTVGRVSMDMLTVDLDPVPAARVGTSVTLWGEGLSCDEVAAAAGTVSYELLCATRGARPAGRPLRMATRPKIDLRLHRMRRAGDQVAGAVPALRRLEHSRRDGR